jgi:4-hydroxybenzoate polyprenyltransferase
LPAIFKGGIVMAKNSKPEGTLAILAAIFVLFTAMLDPRISLAVSVAALLLIAIYSFLKK